MPVREDVLIVVTVQGGQVSVQTLKNVQNQLSKLTGTAAQVAAQFQQALSRLTIPNSVLRSNQQAAQQITLNAGQAAAALQRQAQAAQQAAQAQAQAATSGRQAATAANTLAGGVNAQAEVQKRANLLLIDFSRFAQDAAFGIRAVINNIDPLVLNSERFTAAVSAATGGTATFNNILKSLFATLRGPGGVLVLVAVVFALQELTGLFTPIVNGFKSLAAGLKGVGDPAAKFNEEVGEMVESLLELDERLDLDDAIEDLDQLNEQVERLADRRRAATVIQLLTFLLSGAQPPTRGGIGETLAIDNARIAAEIERLETSRVAFERRVKAFLATRQALLIGDPRVITDRQREIEDAVRRSQENILRLRAEGGERSAQAAALLVELETRASLRALERQRQQIEAELRLTEQARIEINERIAASTDATQRLLGEQQLGTFNAFRDALLAALEVLNRDVLASTESALARTTAAFVAARREINQGLVEATQTGDRLRAQTIENEFERRVALIRQEAEVAKEAEEARTRNFRGNAFERDFLEDQIRDNKKLLDAAAEREIDDLRKQFAEERSRRENQFAERLASLRIEAIEDELDRELASLAERQRQLIALAVEAAASEEVIAEIERIFEALAVRLRQQFAQQFERFAEEVQADFDRIDILKDFEPPPEFTEKGDPFGLQKALKEAQEDLLANARLRTQLFADEVRERERQINDSFRRIEQATRQVFSQIFRSIFAEITAPGRFFEEEIEAQRLRFQQEERDLNQSLRNREISLREFTVKSKLLARERSEFEKEVERDKNRVVVALQEGIVDAFLNATARIIADFLSRAIITAAIGQAARTKALTETLAFHAAALPSATQLAITQSIASFGTAAVAGLGAYSTAVGAAHALSLASAGFASGGFTGRGSSSEEAGVVHRGEFVFPADVVRGDPRPFYALMQAIKAGLGPGSILGFLAQRGFRLDAATMLRTVGMSEGAFQAGGFVAAPTSAAGGDGSHITRELQLLRGDFASLARRITEIEFVGRVAATDRQIRDLNRLARRRERRVRSGKQ